MYTVISEESFDIVDQVKGSWSAIWGHKSSNWYTGSSTVAEYRGAIHSLLIKTSRETKTYADHICIPDTLNNTLSNLRVLYPSLSIMNTRKQRNTANNYRGVSQYYHKWKVEFKFRGEYRYVGLYDTEKEARAVSDVYYAEHAPDTIPTPPNAIYIPGSRSIFLIVPDYIYEKAGVLHLREQQLKTSEA